MNFPLNAKHNDASNEYKVQELSAVLNLLCPVLYLKLLYTGFINEECF